MLYMLDVYPIIEGNIIALGQDEDAVPWLN
jgi:hypothetical protein